MAIKKRTPRGQMVLDWLQNFPQSPTMTVAKAIWETEEGKLLFENLEHVRAICRYYRDEMGNVNRKKSKTKVATTKKTILEKLKAVEIPTLDFQTEFLLPQGFRRILVISDLHVPYHDSIAIAAALEFASTKDIDCVLINGDFMDFPEISRYDRDITKANLQYAFDAGVVVLDTIKECLPKAKIYYKIGNHDLRLKAFVDLKAPQLKGLRGLSLEENLNFTNLNIDVIESLQKTMIGDFIVLHGHELRQGLMAPVNPARGLYLKAQASAMMGHCHRTSSHTERPINGKTIRTYSTGCLCNLKAEYDPHNKWNHGFAIIERQKEGVKISNYTIENGVVE